MTPPAALDIETLWKIERLGLPALSPDGRRVVCTLTRHSMQRNDSQSSLWLLPTTRCAPRRLTACGRKDGQPAWSPGGERIAFVAQRDQQGQPDETAQLYVIGADGGEAERVSRFAAGVESFKWMPDGRRILFAAWVWPGVKGAAAQAREHARFSQREDSGYATSEAFYRCWDRNLPQGRVLHLLLLDLGSGRVRDLFEGTPLELPRDSSGNAGYDVHPDGGRIAFVHDPGAEPKLGQRLALSELDLATRRLRRLVDDADWDFGAPRYRPDGRQLAATAAPVGRHHLALPQLALVESGRARRGAQARAAWRVLGVAWDHAVNAPLRWSTAGDALTFSAEERGRCALWRCRVADEAFDRVYPGGWVQGFDVAGDRVVVAADSAVHPVRLYAWQGAQAPVRVERFNDRLLRRVRFGAVREQIVTGALGEPVQMWLTFAPDFDPERKHPVLHVIHGGPHAAAGDTFSSRWNPHLLAAPGQVVAQVNYHGSSGFGQAFRTSLVGRQGELELQDIEAGTDWLLAQRWADRRRVFATGGSYGGFLVAWMNGHVPAGHYRAYVCHAGVFDRVATFSADSYPERPKDLAANYWTDLPRVLAQSPATFAARMDTPTLVIHGAKDYRVPDCNGLAYYNTLKARGVRARLLWFPDENHWVLKPRNSRQWYAEFLDWLQASAKAESAPAKRR